MSLELFIINQLTIENRYHKPIKIKSHSYIPSTTTIASTKNCLYASREPPRSNDRSDPIVSNITPCLELKAINKFSIRKQTKQTETKTSQIEPKYKPKRRLGEERKNSTDHRQNRRSLAVVKNSGKVFRCVRN